MDDYFDNNLELLPLIYLNESPEVDCNSHMESLIKWKVNLSDLHSKYTANNTDKGFRHENNVLKGSWVAIVIFVIKYTIFNVNDQVFKDLSVQN